MDSVEGVLVPYIHEHLMMPWNDLRRGDCCRIFESATGGFYCKICDFFIHKECIESPETIQHLSHSAHLLKLGLKSGDNYCDSCGRRVANICYRCEICDFDLDLYCAKYRPPDVIDVSETHAHELTLLKDKEGNEFHCSANCGRVGYGYYPHYKCYKCDLAFHVECVWHPSQVTYPLEVKHSHHSLHPLKLLTGHPPDYSDGKCRLCGRKIDIFFYHCSSCNFTVDMCCVLNPPPPSLLDLKAHDHQFTLLPRLDSFTCNACGLKGDRSPYACFQCGFMIHQDCLGLPRLININRHDHRVSRTSVLGVVNSVCGVCRQKVDWTCGGYSCKRCSGYVVHSKCATRKDVWNGKELEGIPEETEDIEPYVVTDENTIQHFIHKEHYLWLHLDSFAYEEKKWCNLCSHPIGLQSFYGCMDCDFNLHKNCAEFPKKKWHVLHNEQLTLVTSKADFLMCDACRKFSSGFVYQHGNKILDVMCASISEPFVHPSHPYHPLFYIPTGKDEICNGCHRKQRNVLRCIEDGCGFFLDFECATLPQVVKHRVEDHPLSLCYGEKASGIYWCDICERKTDPQKWFYTCKDERASLHTKCVLGDVAGIMPRSTFEESDGEKFEAVLNNSSSRPFCRECKNRCIYPVIFKSLGTSDTYICSTICSNALWTIWVGKIRDDFRNNILQESSSPSIDLI